MLAASAAASVAMRWLVSRYHTRSTVHRRGYSKHAVSVGCVVHALLTTLPPIGCLSTPIALVRKRRSTPCAPASHASETRWARTQARWLVAYWTLVLSGPGSTWNTVPEHFKKLNFTTLGAGKT